MGKEWFYEGRYHKEEEYGQAYPITKSNADLTKILQEKMMRRAATLPRLAWDILKSHPYAEVTAE